MGHQEKPVVNSETPSIRRSESSEQRQVRIEQRVCACCLLGQALVLRKLAGSLRPPPFMQGRKTCVPCLKSLFLKQLS